MKAWMGGARRRAKEASKLTKKRKRAVVRDPSSLAEEDGVNTTTQPVENIMPWKPGLCVSKSLDFALLSQGRGTSSIPAALACPNEVEEELYQRALARGGHSLQPTPQDYRHQGLSPPAFEDNARRSKQDHQTVHRCQDRNSLEKDEVMEALLDGEESAPPLPKGKSFLQRLRDSTHNPLNDVMSKGFLKSQLRQDFLASYAPDQLKGISERHYQPILRTPQPEIPQTPSCLVTPEEYKIIDPHVEQPQALLDDEILRMMSTEPKATPQGVQHGSFPRREQHTSFPGPVQSSQISKSDIDDTWDFGVPTPSEAWHKTIQVEWAPRHRRGDMDEGKRPSKCNEHESSARQILPVVVPQIVENKIVRHENITREAPERGQLQTTTVTDSTWFCFMSTALDSAMEHDGTAPIADPNTNQHDVTGAATWHGQKVVKQQTTLQRTPHFSRQTSHQPRSFFKTPTARQQSTVVIEELDDEKIDSDILASDILASDEGDMNFCRGMEPHSRYTPPKYNKDREQYLPNESEIVRVHES